MTPALSRFINCARWIAALFVVLQHVHALFVNQADIMSVRHAPPVYVWWFFATYTFAHGAVVVFFVLSGFLVGGGVIERTRAGKVYLRDYVIDRISRIYIVLLPTLALVFILDSVGRRIFAGLNIYEHPIYHGVFNPLYLLGTIVNLQGIWLPTFGTDAALWTLGMEFWYYIVCGLVLLPLSSAYAADARWAGGALGVVLFVALAIAPGYFLFGAAIWATGAAIRIAPRPLVRSKWLALLIWIAAVTTLRLVTRGAIIEDHPRMELIDSINALLFANVLLTLRFDQGEGFAWCRAKFHHAMADFSYTLYATHMPMLAWIWALTALLLGPDWRQSLATPLHYAWAAGSVVALIALSYAISRVTEAHTADLRRWLRRVTPGGAPATAAQSVDGN